MGARQRALAQPSPSAGVGRLLTPATSALHVCTVTLLYIDIYAMARHPSCGRLCTHQIHCEPKHAFRTRTGVRTHARAHRPTLTNGEVLQFGFSHRVSWNFNRLCSLSGMVDGGADMSLQFAQVAHRTACNRQPAATCVGGCVGWWFLQNGAWWALCGRVERAMNTLLCK